MTTDYERFVNRTSRSSGAVGTRPVCYKWALRLTSTGIWMGGLGTSFRLSPERVRVLDFGCGKGARHALALKAAGLAEVHPWDIGDNSPGVGKPSGKYNLVILSNVLNVQPDADDVSRVLQEAWSYVDELGFMILNYPKNPRHNGVTDNKLRDLIIEKTNADWYFIARYCYLLHHPFQLRPGVKQLANGNWGVIGDEFTEDDAWGEYPDQKTALQARQALEASNWDANVVTGLKIVSP